MTISNQIKSSDFSGAALASADIGTIEMDSLFNVLQEKIRGSSFLDLFAGSGAIGIEALSRNAVNMVFVENHVSSLALIKKNLEKCAFANRQIEIIRGKTP